MSALYIITSREICISIWFTIGSLQNTFLEERFTSITLLEPQKDTFTVRPEYDKAQSLRANTHLTEYILTKAG